MTQPARATSSALEDGRQRRPQRSSVVVRAKQGGHGIVETLGCSLEGDVQNRDLDSLHALPYRKIVNTILVYRETVASHSRYERFSWTSNV